MKATLAPIEDPRELQRRLLGLYKAVHFLGAELNMVKAGADKFGMQLDRAAFYSFMRYRLDMLILRNEIATMLGMSGDDMDKAIRFVENPLAHIYDAADSA